MVCSLSRFMCFCLFWTCLLLIVQRPLSLVGHMGCQSNCLNQPCKLCLLCICPKSNGLLIITVYVFLSILDMFIAHCSETALTSGTYGVSIKLSQPALDRKSVV